MGHQRKFGTIMLLIVSDCDMRASTLDYEGGFCILYSDMPLTSDFNL